MKTSQYIADQALKAGIFDQRDRVYRLRRLAAKYHRQAENACNGEGYIPRKGFYRCDNDKAYVTPDVSVFDAEMTRLEKEINCAVAGIPGARVEIQNDPRGWEIKLIVNDRDISEVVYNK